MKVASFVVLAALMIAAGTAAGAAANIYGMSGLIETPDDSIVAPRALELTGHYISDLDPTDANWKTFGGAFGLGSKLEVSAVGIDPDIVGLSTKVVINAKYRVLGESIERPSITIGVVDFGSKLEDYNSDIENASTFVVFGKNISPIAEGVSGMISKPVRGTLGFGTGVYKGVFAGFSWSMLPKVDIVAEYLSKGIRQKSTVNAAVRFTPASQVSIQAGTHAFKSFYVGASLNLAAY